MADFRIKIGNKYTTDTYENTKLTYQWIYNAMTEASIINAKIKETFMFYIGEICCSCNSMKEFTDNAYGQNSFELIQMKLFQIDISAEKQLFIYVDDKGISITTNNKADLEKMVSILKREEKNAEKHIGNYYNISNISANNVNINQGDNNTINPSIQKKSKSRIKYWIDAIAQNILANWIWYLLGLLISGGGVYYLFH